MPGVTVFVGFHFWAIGGQCSTSGGGGGGERGGGVQIGVCGAYREILLAMDYESFE